MKITKLVSDCRRQLGYTQEQFAKMFNTTANTVSRWESGKYEVPNNVLERLLSDEFGVIEVICPLCRGTGLYKKVGHQVRETKPDDTYVVPDMSKNYVVPNFSVDPLIDESRFTEENI